MVKIRLNPIRLILTGLLWWGFYLKVIMPPVGVFFDFDFLSRQAWIERYVAFVNYRWTINNPAETSLFLVMLLWIPAGFFGWIFIYRLSRPFKLPRIRGFFRGLFRSRMKKKYVLPDQEKKPIYHMPRKMPSLIQATPYVAPKLPGQVEEVVSGNKSHTNLVQMIRMIATLARKYKVEIFQHILLEGYKVPLAISTDARAVLIEIVNKKGVNWSVEFSEDVTSGGWYSEAGVMDRLAQDLMGASASLAKSEPNSEILSAIIVTDGRVLNAKQAVDYFKSKGIFLIGYNNAEPSDELLDLPTFLSTYFDLKAGETDPAPHPVKKIPLKSESQQSEQDAESAADEDDVSVDENPEEPEEIPHVGPIVAEDEDDVSADENLEEPEEIPHVGPIVAEDEDTADVEDADDDSDADTNRN